MTDQSFIENKIMEFCVNNDKNMEISSDKYFKFPCCLGIDEAGRGPVLGPMVYAGAYIEIKNIEKISNIGLDDSKKLKEETREEIFTLLSNNEKKLCGFEVEIISPNVISNQMLNIRKTNLNTLSHDAAINIIKKVIDKGINLKEVYVDTVGSPDKYKSLILSHFPDLKVTVESKADATYKVVSAASVFAKVVRDRCIRGWRHREATEFPGSDCGSGYPSDPVTKDFLKQIFHPIFGFPQFVRASWSTASSVMDKDCLPIEWEDDDVVVHQTKFSRVAPKRNSVGHRVTTQTKSLLDFYRPSVTVDKRYKFFTARKLERVAAFR